MNEEKKFFPLVSDEKLSGYFRWLSVCTTVALVGMIVLSVAEFGQEGRERHSATAEETVNAVVGHKYVYEQDYLAGIIAGLHTRTNRVGYVAEASTEKIYQRINSYALGVQTVNSGAQVLLVWTHPNDDEGETRAVHLLKGERADMLAYSLQGREVPLAADRLNLPFVSPDGDSGHYSQCLAKVGHIPRGATEWELTLTPLKLSSREIAYGETRRKQIAKGLIIFAGEIYDRGGLKRCSAGEAMSRASRDRMDWLVKGVSVLES